MYDVIRCATVPVLLCLFCQVHAVCMSIVSMLSSAQEKVRPKDRTFFYVLFFLVTSATLVVTGALLVTKKLFNSLLFRIANIVTTSKALVTTSVALVTSNSMRYVRNMMILSYVTRTTRHTFQGWDIDRQSCRAPSLSQNFSPAECSKQIAIQNRIDMD